VYLPRHFTVTDMSHIAAFVDAAESADLVTFDGTKPVATLLPVIWERPPELLSTPAEPLAAPAESSEAPAESSEAPAESSAARAEPPVPAEASPDADGRPRATDYGRLLGHVAIANPQWQTASPCALALAIVHGPQAYISPGWYESKTRHGRVVPTWNYETVHLTGTLTIHRDPEWLRALVTRLTRRHESRRERPWAVTDAPPRYVDGQLKAIVGVELTITSVEAKQKLSQNRSVLDQAGVVAGLREQPGPGPAAVADLMADALERESAESAEPDLT
jgi:transcriptional regulator